MKAYSGRIGTSAPDPQDPSEISYKDEAARSSDALNKFNAVANKYPSTLPGKQARYYAALCLDRPGAPEPGTRRFEEVGGRRDKELASMAQYQMGVIYSRTGKPDEAAKILRELAEKHSVFVPRPVALLELANVLRQSNPKEAANVYQQVKKNFRIPLFPSRPPVAWSARAEILAPNQQEDRSSPLQQSSALAPWAMRAEQSRGRRYPEPPHPYRSEYARDRDRIIHSRAFRRLEAKTQVFTTRFSDHFRNRLTHTLEVTQIARTVATALGLNSEFGRSAGAGPRHRPPRVGHSGERALDALMRPYGGSCNHNLHALRIVEKFEQRYLDFPGLNLTFEVREGIHQTFTPVFGGGGSQLAEYLLDLHHHLKRN